MAYMLVANILFNSIISKKVARSMTIYMFNFYLMTPMKRPEYISIHVRDIPYKIIKEYILKGKTDEKGVVYIVPNRRMYGLPQSRLLANELLEKRLNKRG